MRYQPPQAQPGRRRQTPQGTHPGRADGPIVRRIFAEFLAGIGIYAIAEGLTANHVPCPSAHERTRNRHRSGIAWSKSAVDATFVACTGTATRPNRPARPPSWRSTCSPSSGS
ncbi:recombinase family protein [Micromonospora sp. BQ11]|uniref:recombinase family protein n=1 Tax=Micromonospora sp. BQ11 TaxID=3452212 RepID=UPI003F89BF86